METTVIAAIIGAGAAGLVSIIKALFTRNQNSKDRMDHELELIKVVNTQNQTSEKIVFELGRLNSSVESIKEDMKDFNQRLERLEQKEPKS